MTNPMEAAASSLDFCPGSRAGIRFRFSVDPSTGERRPLVAIATCEHGSWTNLEEARDAHAQPRAIKPLNEIAEFGA